MLKTADTGGWPRIPLFWPRPGGLGIFNAADTEILAIQAAGRHPPLRGGRVFQRRSLGPQLSEEPALHSRGCACHFESRKRPFPAEVWDSSARKFFSKPDQIEARLKRTRRRPCQSGRGLSMRWHQYLAALERSAGVMDRKQSQRLLAEGSAEVRKAQGRLPVQ